VWRSTGGHPDNRPDLPRRSTGIPAAAGAGYLLMWIIRMVFPTIRLEWADGAYAG
jgi:hypothetical protein